MTRAELDAAAGEAADRDAAGRERAVRDATDRELIGLAPSGGDRCRVCRAVFEPRNAVIADAHEVCYWRERSGRFEDELYALKEKLAELVKLVQ